MNGNKQWANKWLAQVASGKLYGLENQGSFDDAARETTRKYGNIAKTVRYPGRFLAGLDYKIKAEDNEDCNG